MSVDLDRFHMVSDRDPTFPWGKFERLLQVPEVFRPQWEDGLPTEPSQAVGTQEPRPHQFIWLVMEGPKAWGFVAAGLRGKHWVDLHVGSRKGLPGVVRKATLTWVLARLFFVLGLKKASGFIPEYNLPARIMVRQMGFALEGRISKAFWRNGRGYDVLVYGVTCDEFSNWLRVVGEKRADHPAEQPGYGSNGGLEPAVERPERWQCS